MIVRPSNYLKCDPRWRAWGKVVTATDIDLTKEGGYALGGKWVGFDDAVALDPGEYLVCAAETGSRKNHSYGYALVTHTGETVSKEKRIALLDAALAQGLITEKQRAAAKNSVLYSYALYIVVEKKLGEEEK